MKRYDVVIVGAGPAGIFAALELSSRPGLRIAMLEKGRDLADRMAPDDPNRRVGPINSGWGGAGAWSDGKLTLSAEVGGHLAALLPPDRLDPLIEEVDNLYVHYGAPDRLYGASDGTMRELTRRAALAELELVPTRVRHMGTEHCVQVLQAMRQTLGQRVEIATGLAAAEIIVEGGVVKGVRTVHGDYRARYVIVAPGRDGAAWLTKETDRLRLPRVDNPVDVGVRVELAAATFLPLTKEVYEPKLVFHSKQFDDRVRTFCVCPYGEVVTETSDDVTTVNGHSYAGKRTDNTNFALLVTTHFTEPFHEPIAYGRYLARLANLLSGGIIVQRLGDLKAGRRSTPERISRGLVEPTLREATPGDLSFVLPYRHLSDLMEMLEALDHLAPGTAGRHTLLYGVEVKFYSARPRLSSVLETDVRHLFAIGDGAGVTRGLVQASVSGLVAAREILSREQSRAAQSAKRPE